MTESSATPSLNGLLGQQPADLLSGVQTCRCVASPPPAELVPIGEFDDALWVLLRSPIGPRTPEEFTAWRARGFYMTRGFVDLPCKLEDASERIVGKVIDHLVPVGCH